MTEIFRSAGPNSLAPRKKLQTYAGSCVVGGGGASHGAEWDESRVVTSTLSAASRRQPRSKHSRTQALLVAMSISYGVLWLPFISLTLYLHMGPGKNMGAQRSVKIIDETCKMISMLSICVNPFLYGYLNTNFNREFRAIIGSLLKMSRCCSARAEQARNAALIGRNQLANGKRQISKKRCSSTTGGSTVASGAGHCSSNNHHNYQVFKESSVGVNNHFCGENFLNNALAADKNNVDSAALLISGNGTGPSNLISTSGIAEYSEND